MGLTFNGNPVSKVTINSGQDVNYLIKDGKLVWADPNIYLHSDGNQYIQTNYVPVQYDAINTEFKLSSLPPSYYYAAIYYAGKGTYQLGVVLESNKVYTKYFRTGSVTGIGISFNTTTWYKAEMNGQGTTYIGNNSVSDTYQAPLDGNNTTLRLFKRSNNTSPLIGAIKTFRITNNNIDKLYLVPVPAGLVIGNYTVPSNGMFDIVTQTFYGNAGTGTFTIGKSS